MKYEATMVQSRVKTDQVSIVPGVVVLRHTCERWEKRQPTEASKELINEHVVRLDPRMQSQ